MIVKAIIPAATATLIAILLFTGQYFYRQKVIWQHQAEEWKTAAQTANDTIRKLQTDAAEIAKLDEQQTRELNNAKAEIETLRDSVNAGTKRVYVNATCKSVPATASTPGMADAAAPRLTEDAEQNYWRLRTQIEEITAQINGLQNYIHQIRGERAQAHKE